MSDLLLDVAIDGAPSRGALEEGLRSAIRGGRLRPGTSLPSSRTLAADLGISRSTVVGAYEQLVAEGYLHAAHGSGTRVSDLRERAVDAEEPDVFGPTPRHDFRPGEPDPSSFPRQRWMRSLRRVMHTIPDSAFRYHDPRGVAELRGRLADHLARTRSVDVSMAGVRVVGGYGAAVGFLGETLRQGGIERVAIEDPTLPMYTGVLRSTGLRTVPVAVDANGIDVEQLDSADVGAVVVTPAHQYPTGVTMSAQRRLELIDWARRRGAWIIEDDYDGEFRYDRRPIGALQGLAPDRVVYAGTASKSLTPALRIGWMVVPEPLRAPLLRVSNVRAGVSALDQLAMADFIERGELDRHVRLMRGRYRRRRMQLRDVLAASAPWLRVGEGAAGLHLAAYIDADVQGVDGLDEATVLAAADRRSVGLFGLRTHHRSVSVGAGFAIGFSRPAEHHFPAALAQLGAVLEQG